MSVELVNPSALPEVPLYHQVAVARGSRTVHVAGQVAVDGEGALVGDGDLAAQVQRAYLNLHAALAAVDAGLHDLVRVTVYVVDWRPEKMAALVEGVARAAAAVGVPVPTAPLTGIGVAALADPALLVEVEGTAVLP